MDGLLEFPRDEIFLYQQNCFFVIINDLIELKIKYEARFQRDW